MQPGYHARLATEEAEVLELDSRVWKSQIMTRIRYREVIEAADKASAECKVEELFFFFCGNS